MKQKHLPHRVDPKIVAKRQRQIRLAQTQPKSYTLTELNAFQKLKKNAPKTQLNESLLGKNKMIITTIASAVYKVKADGEFTSSGTCVSDKVVVPLHGHISGTSVSAVNYKTNAVMPGELIPVAEDLGVYVHCGTVKCEKRWLMRPPKNEQVMQVGFTAGDQMEPEYGIGFCSASGLYDAPTKPGDCGGPVVACSDGALVGFHIAGGTDVNRFVPMTEDLAKRLKASGPVLSSMDFP